MKAKTKYKKLRFRIWLYFILFAVFSIVFIWILQAFLFEFNYRNEKGKTILSSGEFIYSVLSTNGDTQTIERPIVELNEAGIEVAVISKDGGAINFVYPIKPALTQADEYYGTYSFIINEVDVSDAAKAVSSITEENKVMYYGRKLVLQDEEYYLTLTCKMNTLNDVVKTLQNQLIITAAISIIVSFFVSYAIAGKLSAPIDDMSAVAKSWAKGNDNVQFNGGDYQEINELANALNFAKDEKTKAEALQRDLMANVTHDLKTPLTMIRAYAEKIRDLTGDNKQKRDKDTAVIIEEADRLTSLVNDILNLSKLQSNVTTPELKTFNLSELTENVVYRFTQALSEKGFIISSDVEQNVYVNADEKRIEEVLYNLIGNSINYTGEDKTVKVYLTVQGESANLEILDSGKGIEKDQIDGIWERYLRYSETHQRAVKGTGLGLSIVKTILDAHGVKYGVISKKDVGSNFYIRFELAKEPKAEEIENG